MPCPSRLASLLLLTAFLVLLGCGRDPSKKAAQPAKPGPEGKEVAASAKDPAQDGKEKKDSPDNQVTMLVKGMV